MKRKATHFLAAAALLALGAASLLACPLAFVVNFSGQFGLIDLATGAFTPIGKGLDNTPDGIAGKPGGPYYTVDGVTGHLIRIGIDGKTTDVGDTHTGPNAGPVGISLIGSLTDGTIYALDFSNRLFRINPDTAALTGVAWLITLPQQELDYSGNMTTSLTGDGNLLYYTVEIMEGARKTGPTLYIIDPVKLSVTARPLKNLPSRIIGSGIVNGVFYLFGEGGHILTLNPATGDTKLVSRYESNNADGPPLTGIFGVTSAAEPNALGPPPKHSEELERPIVRSNWPPRWVPSAKR